jgi:hypothetical protein
MTKKDYILLADSLKDLVEAEREVDCLNDSAELKLSQLRLNIMRYIAKLGISLIKDNPNFDDEKFRKAINFR